MLNQLWQHNSLFFTVGTSALFGSFQKKQKLVDFKKYFYLEYLLLSVFITRKIIVPSIPDVIFSSSAFTLHKSVLIMIVFAIVMIMASVRMIKPLKEKMR
jgi:hypothetical protein